MAKSVRIRMYRQGLGDCFLLTFPKETGEAHVLIDFGVLQGTDSATAIMNDVATDIVNTTGGRLDALAATHQHWDHVSGFGTAQGILAPLKVNEVWLAWTEDPNDDLADELAKRREVAIKAVEATVRKLARVSAPGMRATHNRLSSLLGFYGDFAANARVTTASALQWVKDRPNAKMRYCRQTDAPFTIPGVPDVRIYVLGPPRDKKLLRKSDPSKKDSEVYQLTGTQGTQVGFLAALGSKSLNKIAELNEVMEHPFSRRYRIPKSDAASTALFRNSYLAPDEDWRQIEHDWMGAAQGLALDLDSDTNNTCLVLAFELVKSGRVILFPGDAQVGNWLSWQGLSWTVGEEHEARVVETRDLLARTVLYKVGHHGSHNATLRAQGLELMTHQELAAMIPVNKEMAQEKEWNMPFPPLLAALKQKTRGRIMEADSGLIEDSPVTLSESERDKFRRSVRIEPGTPGWIDYFVEC